MGKKQMVRVYTPEAVEKAAILTHDAYKTLKHSNKVEMTAKLQQIWRSGYEKGYEAGKKETAAKESALSKNPAAGD